LKGLHEIGEDASSVESFLRYRVRPVLDNFYCRASHDQGAYSVMTEAVHTATFQSELAKQWLKMLIENGRVHERGAFRLVGLPQRTSISRRCALGRPDSRTIDLLGLLCPPFIIYGVRRKG
jgi:hypothetical protein